MTHRESLPIDSPRTTIDLDGDWEFVTDPDAMGEDAEWSEPNAAWPDRSRSITVPHSWQEHDDLTEYTGNAWYRRTVDIPAVDDRDVFLRFGAVDYEATVWVNGTRVGTNRGGYLPFEFEISDALSPGQNHVAVAVSDPEDLSEIPHGKQGDPWYTRVSGIWQSVSLDLRPRTRVTVAKITPDLMTDTAHVELEVALGDVDPAGLEYVVEARHDGDVVTSTYGPVTADASDVADVDLDTALSFDDPTYWSPDNPVLYDLEVRLVCNDEVLDRYADTFGLRSFSVEDGEFRLNGETITMRGVLEQGYYPQTNYRPPHEDTFEQEIRIAKELGFNLIRKHIKPAHPAFLAEADRQGMLVWEEPANSTRFTERSRTELVDQLHGLIARDYNRPSVVVWSLYNEEWGIGHEDGEETLWTDEEKQTFLADLYRSIRERDVTRVVCDNSGWAHVATDINDFHRYFVSPDRADQWVGDLDHICAHPQDNYATTEFDDGDAPVVISELGTWGLGDVSALRDHYGGDPNWFGHEFLTNPIKRAEGFDDRFTESDLAEVFGDMDSLENAWQWRQFVSIKHLIEEIRTRPTIDGYVLTELSDIEWEFNGILDYLRNEKVFHDDFAAVNGAVSVVAEPASHVGWSGDSLPVTLTVVNDSQETLFGTLTWSVGEQSGSKAVSIPAHEVTETTILDLAYPPANRGVEATTLSVALEGADRDVRTCEPIFAAERDAVVAPDARVYATGGLGSRLAGGGVDVTHDLSGDVDVAFTDTVTAEADQFAKQGGALVHVPTTDGEMNTNAPFSYHDIPRRESWLETTSLFYQDSDLLAGICEPTRLGWEFEDLYPYAVATDLDRSVDRVHVGYVEGWLTNWSSPLVVRGYGNGSMAALTFRVGDAYGDHPVATLLCNRLVDRLSG
ncbi:beta galactosidase jelly roll domain-containing protein [Halosimplex rubrum]|uniref:Beta galactosidase jelly roll domain-containing protein n=2 Tax=Halosimplex rubrum TaxID=869889 RepID=A0A7D5T8T5_9EURY|nr:beta galactosidase jelly roll domain-containing protein [Halosimplex rubrum]